MYNISQNKYRVSRIKYNMEVSNTKLDNLQPNIWDISKVSALPHNNSI